jgi:hypothetical protein
MYEEFGNLTLGYTGYVCKIDGDWGKWAFIWMVYMDCRTSHRLGTLLLPIIGMSKFGHSIMSS